MIKKLLLFIVLVGLKINAQSVDPLLTKDTNAQEKWVDSILKNMTIDEKIGQLFMVKAYSDPERMSQDYIQETIKKFKMDSPSLNQELTKKQKEIIKNYRKLAKKPSVRFHKRHKKYIEELITKYHVGNLIFMQGTPTKQAKLTNRYQSLSKIPLLIGFDGEWGLDMRLENTYRFPWNMTLGAIQNDSLIQQFGKHIGKHCKRLGIHINFAPVVDINTNPLNPIIGNRSFGEKKENVTKKAIAFTQGLQNEGILANAKHFPGHGDTETDSHKALPYLDFEKTRLDTIELYPYKKIIDKGITSIMTAHLNIPSLESKKDMPTSLSKNVVTNLLQQELGFNGLVITDGLNMKGATNYANSSEIDLQAIHAGNDILLIPQNIPETIKIIKQALKLKTLTEERINKSVRKILKAKYWAGLHNYKPILLKNLKQDLNTIKDEILHRKLVKNSITVIKNENNDVPIVDLRNKKIAYVGMGDDYGLDFYNMLKKYTKVDSISSNSLDKLIEKLQPYNQVIIGYHKSNLHPWKEYNFTDKELVWLHEISRQKKVILNIFASPYSLLEIKSFTNFETIIVSYQNSKLSQELSAQGIFGAFAVNGKLPVSIKEEFKASYGLKTNNLSRLQYTIPEEVGMDSKKLKLIDKYAVDVLKNKMAPGFQILVAREGKVIFQKSYGYHTYNNVQKVKNSDLYDLASLTKILASLPMVMKAEEDGKISLQDNLEQLLPFFKNSNKSNITVQEILSHVSGLKAWIPFYLSTINGKSGVNFKDYYSKVKNSDFNIKVAENLYVKNSIKDSIYKKIRDVKQREKKDYKYSDLGYYLLQEILQKKYNLPLNTLTEQLFYKSLGADRTSFVPLEKYLAEEIVPTEKDNYYRNQLLQGYVHDMGAAMLGGVAGHAGLFGNANDVAKIMQMYLQNGFYGGKRYLKSETIDKFNKRYYADKKIRRGLGFDKPQFNAKKGNTCGCVSDESFGHSGFTGTYTWADPKSGILYVFLSNRVYPTMENRGLIKSNMRTKIQQVIQDAIID